MGNALTPVSMELMSWLFGGFGLILLVLYVVKLWKDGGPPTTGGMSDGMGDSDYYFMGEFD